MARKRKFRFSIEITVTAVLAAALCYSMGVWQYSRWQGKMKYEDDLKRAAERGRLAFDPSTTDWTDLAHVEVATRGAFEHEHTMFLINRSKDNTSGVRVVTPVRLEGSETRLLVDRGFLPFVQYRAEDQSPWKPEGTFDLVGFLRPTQAQAFFLSPSQKLDAGGAFRDRWFRLEVDVMAGQLPYPVFPLYLEQTNQGEGYPVYDAHTVVPSSRHLNYTIQWASFGTFALGFALFLQYRPMRPEQTGEPVSA
ncbi:MAG: SURF1 family protein [Acidobacteriota bacterium]|nr:SURF1 family protein [Acidobacteriota bacterium]